MIFSVLTLFGLIQEPNCTKQIEIQYMYKRVSPVIFHQPKVPWREGKKEKIRINCDLHSRVKVGDLLEDEGDSGLEQVRVTDGFEDGGYLEYRYYKVIKK